MLKFIFVLIVLNSPTEAVVYTAPFAKMDECMEYREGVVEHIGRPIENYQAICIIYNQEKAPN